MLERDGGPTAAGPVTRKVQLAGGSTYTVSLPKEWAREHGVEAGTEVALRANGDGTLLVQAAPADSGDERPTVDVDAHAGVPLADLVRALYVAGHGEFALTGERVSRSSAVRRIEAAARDLVGLTVAGASEGRVVLHDALAPEEISPRQTLLQLRRAACAAFEDAAAGALSPADDTSVADRTAEVDRLFGVVARSFRRSLVDGREVDRLGAGRDTLFDCYRVGRALSHTGTVAGRLAERRAAGLPSALAEDVGTHAGDAASLLADATNAFLEDSTPAADPGDLLGRCEDLRERTRSLRTRLRSDATGGTATGVEVVTASTRVADGAESVAEVVVRRSLVE